MNDKELFQPTASIKNLLNRAVIIAEIRRFFSKKNIIEVDTPSLSNFTVTDVNLSSFKTSFVGPGYSNGLNMYLITSPEYHMKRLLVAGIGAIYQICHSFRNGEIGRYHNPEFNILEWYRPDYNIFQMMNEVNELLQQILNSKKAEILSYQEMFIRYLNIDPLITDINHLRKIVKNQTNLIDIDREDYDYDNLLEILLSTIVESKISSDVPLFIYHFPASQAGLAAINHEDSRLSERFELYYKGLELANGFLELTNSKEYCKRFRLDNYQRIANGLPKQPIDENFILAIEKGLPNCSGVALGIDRLIMLALKATRISEVMAFTVDRC
ncbi:MAG: elongation factor P--(R)-beta-lysine ligase [Candidatus Dasytiphilus stammeri]